MIAILGGLYLGGLIVFTALIVRYIVREDDSGTPDLDDWALGFVTAWFWPFILAGMAVVFPARWLLRKWPS